jgi:hypothetical protein
MGKIKYEAEDRERVIINGQNVGEMWPRGADMGEGFYCTLKIPPLGSGDSLFGSGDTRDGAIKNALEAGRKEQDKLALRLAKYQDACEWLGRALEGGA